MPYRLVCLDAGFTLLAPKRTLAESLAGVLAEQGHPVHRDDVHRAWEIADRWFWDEYHRPDNRTWGDDEAIERTWREYHSLMLSELGFADRAHELLDAILASQFASDAWELYPDVEPALSALRAMPGLTIGIISDWGSNLREIVSGLGLDSHIHFVLASGAVGMAKPDPAFFRIALERAGVEPSAALMVGDSLRADVEGARSAGMDAALLVRDGGGAHVDQAAGREVPAGIPVISSLMELPAMLAGTNEPPAAHRQSPRGMA